MKSCTETGYTIGEPATEGSELGMGSIPWTSDDGPSLLFCCPSLASAEAAAEGWGGTEFT
jgi:hypothetical protein